MLARLWSITLPRRAPDCDLPGGDVLIPAQEQGEAGGPLAVHWQVHIRACKESKVSDGKYGWLRDSLQMLTLQECWPGFEWLAGGFGGPDLPED